MKEEKNMRMYERILLQYLDLILSMFNNVKNNILNSTAAIKILKASLFFKIFNNTVFFINFLFVAQQNIKKYYKRL